MWQRNRGVEGNKNVLIDRKAGAKLGLLETPAFGEHQYIYNASHRLFWKTSLFHDARLCICSQTRSSKFPDAPFR